jgi:lantibiotic modifying enzyme
MLFDSVRHEPLTDEEWDAAAAEAAIRAIVDDTLRASCDGVWPAHPLDEGLPPYGSSLYTGAAGVLWGLSYLADEGAIDQEPRFAAWARKLPERYAASPDTGSLVPSYLLGESGVLLAAMRLGKEPVSLDRLAAVIESNADNPTLEALWGAPGTMVAAVFAYELTAERRFADLYRSNVAALLRTWQRLDGEECELWTQDLYGKRLRYLGPGHGFAGNVYALQRGSALLSAEQNAAIAERALVALRATALVEDGCANWPPFPRAQKLLVQWCHGAPGMTTALARGARHAELDEWLRKAGELTWRAGPLKKGPGLCHGTAGNGAAFLALYARTRDARWLERARRFAMHAIHQADDARRRYGQGRYGLWTGDIGLAVYLWQCRCAATGLPTLDF